ncbi:MAG TPA: DNA polymerase I [Firmicutes bacterium]|nr:DNA polymerase I [Bacillota bacterium]
MIKVKKVILVDGNNLLFRSYFATAYTGNTMRNSKGFPTNGLYGLVNMLNKIIREEKPEYMLVAFDKGKTFRHEKYLDYKGGRNETPDDLKRQFSVAKKLVPLMGIKCFEIDNYEADDIIGTYSKMALIDPEFETTIVSSDKDLLQLINEETEVKLLKQKDYIRMNEETFIDTYGIKPIRMIDLKGLMGDASDNIPGVKGIGEKTALKLLQEYDSLENVYDNIDNIKGATKQKLIDGKESAFMSKDIATIYNEVPVIYSLEELKYDGPDVNGLREIYSDLEFYSFLKDFKEEEKKEEKLEYKIIENIDDLKLKEKVSAYLEISETNYHNADIYGMSLYDGENVYYVPFEVLKENKNILDGKEIYTYDLKKMIVSLNKYDIDIKNCTFDAMIAGYILNYNVKDDIAYLANTFNYDITLFDNFKKEKNMSTEALADLTVKKAKFIYDIKDEFINKMKEEEQLELFSNIEMKLSSVLASMEIEGVRVDTKVLDEMGENINKKLDELTSEIYNYAGEEFNIQSPKQLGEILFEKLEIPYPKKKKTSYSTAREILDKIVDYHPIVEKIIEHRTLNKIYTTYIVGIKNCVKEDGKLHTIYTQTLTRTGRLSSIEPNLQNIPIRYKEGKEIRKAFIPEENSVFLSSDYSQIELRMFAHMSGEQNLIDAFKHHLDIHTKTAMDIYHVSKDEVTKNMRRDAKAVNFGIIYGISSFGLAEDLGVDIKTAKKFLDNYLETFPGIKNYMDKVIKDAYETGYVKTIMNRKRKIDELYNTNHMIKVQGERMALNTPVQGSSADILKKAMIDIYNEFNRLNLKSKMILQVHDELIFNVKNDELEKVKEIVINFMENAYKLNVPLEVDVEIGKNWYDAK